MSDDRVAFGGELSPDRPIFEETPIGPWRARVAVLPLVLRRATIFEVVCSWHGPPLTDGHPDPGTPVDANDSFVAEDRELAIYVAKVAADLLRDGLRPRLPEIARHAPTSA